MAPPVKKARVEGAAAAKDAVDVDESREEQTQLEEQEADANPSKAPISHVVGFNVPDTTMNVMSNANVLKPLSEGGLQTLFGCARANVGLKNGRYMFEVQILEHPACADRNVKPGNLLKVGFATSTSSLFAGDSEDSLCFDSEGSLWCANKKTPICKRWGARGVVVAVLLNLDKNSSNYQTVSLFKDGVRMCPPQSLPEGLKSKTLFPAFTFRNMTLHVNFGPDPLAPLPFKCNMISGAEKADAEIANVPEAPKDGKYEVLYPVCLPGEASYTWLELFMQKNPTYTDLSYKAIASWCKKSGIQGNTQIGDIAKKLKKTAPAQARNYVVFDLDRSFLADRRAQDLAHFPAALFKRIAVTVVGDPTPDFVQHSQALLLKDKQVASDIEFKKRKEEERRKKVMDKKASELERTKKIAEKKRKRAVEEHQRKLAVMAKKAKIEAAKRAGKEVPEEDMEEEEEKAPEPEEEEVEEEEPAEVEEPEVEENPPTVELAPEDKAVKFYLPGNKPDMDPKFLGLSFAKFAMPSKEEGFAEIRHEWNKGSQAEEYLKTWISEKKQTTRVEDIKPSTWFKEQNIRWQKTLREWRGKVEAYRKVLVSKEQQKQQKETMKMKKAAAAKALALRKELEKKRKKELAEHNGEEYIEEEEKEEPAAEEPDEADEEEAPEVDLESVDAFGVEDVADVGQGMPLFMKFGPAPSKCVPGAGKNVILVIGDGMGWEMIRAGAIAKQVLTELEGMGVDTATGATGSLATSAKAAFAGRTTADYYTEGKGSGLSFQDLTGYTMVTTSAMVLQEANEGAWYAPSGQSMLQGATRPSFTSPGVMSSGHDNGMAPLAQDSSGQPLNFDPRDYESEGGNMVLWDDVKGGAFPWDGNYHKAAADRDSKFDVRFRQRHATDSASTAGALATGVKSFTGSFSVDIYEAPVRTIVEDAMHCGKAGGTVTSVPMLHATPAAFISHSNHRYNGPQMQRTMMQTVNPTLAVGACASRYYPGGKLGSEHNTDYQAKIANGAYGNWTVIKTHANQTAAEALAKMADLNPEHGHKVMGCIPDGTYNMPYRGLDSSYSHAVLQDRETETDDDGNVVDIKHANTMGHAYTSDELQTIPKMKDIVKSSLEFLAKDPEGFFMMYEQGDIDWAAHANHMDDMLGTMLDIDDSVAEIISWIQSNGGWDKNALYVTADHDHFLTLKPNFPEIVANFLIDGESHKITPNTTLSGGYEAAAKLSDFSKGGTKISDPTGVKTMAELQGWAPGTIDQVGHFWGVEEDGGNAWGSHSAMPVPLSYQGDTGDCIKKLEGKSYKVHGKTVKGSPGKVDQVHVHACMYKALMGF